MSWMLMWIVDIEDLVNYVYIVRVDYLHSKILVTD
jgi:hypothetical protein